MPKQKQKVIYATEHTHEIISKRADTHYRSIKDEVAAVFDDLDEKDKVAGLNVPVLQEKKTMEEEMPK